MLLCFIFCDQRKTKLRLDFHFCFLFYRVKQPLNILNFIFRCQRHIQICMYNVDLRRKRRILPSKLYKKKNTVINCFKTYVNYLYLSVFSSNGIISYIAQTQHFRECQIPKDQNWSSSSDKFVFQKVYSFKHLSQWLPSIWSVLLKYLHHFYVVIFYGVFYVFVCLWFCCCFAIVLFSSFLVSFLAKALSLTVKIQSLRQPLLNWI